MSGQHTQARLYIGGQNNEYVELCHDNKEPGAISLVMAKVIARPSWREEGKANARRLAAAWNVCDNVPTEDIEELTEAGGVLPLVVFYEDAKQELAAARALLQKEMQAHEDNNRFESAESIRSFLEGK